jgi:YidC/Oxa1 family membrane protein insertase
MNKNTILAFLLIVASISLFTSKFYYEKILKIPHPSTVARLAAEEKKESDVENTVAKGIVSESPDAFVAPEVLTTRLNDTIAIVSGHMVADFDTIWVKTDKLTVGISESGARIISVKTNEYRKDPVSINKSFEENPLIELISLPDSGGVNLSINNTSFDRAVFSCDREEDSVKISGDEKVEIIFVCRDSTGNTLVEKRFSFSGTGYLAGVEIFSPQLNGKKVMLSWNCGIAESEAVINKQSSAYNIRKVHLFDGRNVSQIADKKESKSEESGFYKWVSLTSKYFVISIISDSVKDEDVLIESYEEKAAVAADGEKKKKEKLFNYRMSTQRFASGSSEKYSLYMGPSQVDELKKHKIKLEKILFGGWKWFLWADIWFPAICEFVLWLLIMLQKVFRDYGIVIIVLTILSRLVTYPLTQSSMKSMNRMRDLQPKITELREKHKNDAKKMNQKMMDLYKKEGINPLNPGCLPMFLQMPVFIALFIVLQKSIELRGRGTWLVPWVHDLSRPEVLPIPFINPLPFEIPMYGSNVALLPIIMAVLTYFQNKATIKDPNQKMMIYFMPVFMLLLFNNFPSGLVIYWTFSSALGIAQQYWTDRGKKKQAATVKKT